MTCSFGRVSDSYVKTQMQPVPVLECSDVVCDIKKTCCDRFMKPSPGCASMDVLCTILAASPAIQTDFFFLLAEIVLRRLFSLNDEEHHKGSFTALSCFSHILTQGIPRLLAHSHVLLNLPHIVPWLLDVQLLPCYL